MYIVGEGEVPKALDLHPNAAVVSVRDPEDDAHDWFKRVHPDRLCALQLDDVTRDHPRLGRFAPKREHVVSVMTFARRVRTAETPMIVHCAAGISRSAALAIAIEAERVGWQEAAPSKRAVAEVLRHIDRTEAAGLRAWSIHPNARIVEHADSILALDGALVDAADLPWAMSGDPAGRASLIAHLVRS